MLNIKDTNLKLKNILQLPMWKSLWIDPKLVRIDELVLKPFKEKFALKLSHLYYVSNDIGCYLY